MLRPITNYKGQMKSAFALIYLDKCDIDSKDFLNQIVSNTCLFVGNLIRAIDREDFELILAIDYAQVQGSQSRLLHLEETKRVPREKDIIWVIDGINSIQKDLDKELGKGRVTFLGINTSSSPLDIRKNPQDSIIAFCTGANQKLQQWTQDLFWVLHNPKEPQNSKLLIAEELSIDGFRKFAFPSLRAFLQNRNYNILTTDLPLEGGNILVGEDFMIIGKDHVTQYQKETGESYETILDWYWAAFKFGNPCRKVFVPEYGMIGNYQRQPWPLGTNEITSVSPTLDQLIYHIDLYLTLGGKLENGKQLIFIAEYKNHDYYIGETLSDTKVNDTLKILGEWLDDQANWFQAMTGNFFQVERIPLAYYEPPAGLVSFNNGLIEVNSETEKCAYLPEYQFENYPDKMDYFKKLVEEPLKKHHFKIKWIQGKFEQFVSKGASLHCRVKVLDRQ